MPDMSGGHHTHRSLDTPGRPLGQRRQDRRGNGCRSRREKVESNWRRKTHTVRFPQSGHTRAHNKNPIDTPHNLQTLNTDDIRDILTCNIEIRFGNRRESNHSASENTVGLSCQCIDSYAFENTCRG